jgi:hypothetical protein
MLQAKEAEHNEMLSDKCFHIGLNVLLLLLISALGFARE